MVNVGDEDAERLIAVLFSNEMGINIREPISDDLEAGEEETVAFEFNVPQGLEDKGYRLVLTSEYEIDDDRQSSNVEQSILLNVVGCKFTTGGTPGTPGTPGTTPTTGQGNVIITASLGSDAKAGEELVVNSLITNAGTEEAIFIIDSTGYQSWADLQSVAPRTLTLSPGESGAVTFTFNVNEEVSGAETFSIETNSNGRIQTREVEVNIQGTESGTSGITGAATGLDFSGNNLIWIIAIVNIILIILIILVAVRLSRR